MFPRSAWPVDPGGVALWPPPYHGFRWAGILFLVWLAWETRT